MEEDEDEAKVLDRTFVSESIAVPMQVSEFKYQSWNSSNQGLYSTKTNKGSFKSTLKKHGTSSSFV